MLTHNQLFSKEDVYKRKKVALIGLLAATAGAPTIALAQQDAGFYIGASAGQAKINDACTRLTSGGFAGGCDDKNTAWKIFGGYQFNRNFGVEGGYTNIGEATAIGTIGTTGNRRGRAGSVKAEAKGFELLTVGTLPINEQFAVYGKAGFFRWDVDMSGTRGRPSVAIDDKVTYLTLGVGLKYNLTKNLAARLEFQRYDDFGVGDNPFTGQMSVNVSSLGLQFKF